MLVFFYTELPGWYVLWKAQRKTKPSVSGRSFLCKLTELKNV
jgi:hypothetical protein